MSITLTVQLADLIREAAPLNVVVRHEASLLEFVNLVFHLRCIRHPSRIIGSLHLLCEPVIGLRGNPAWRVPRAFHATTILEIPAARISLRHMSQTTTGELSNAAM